MIKILLFVQFAYFPPIGGTPLEGPEYRDINSKFLLQCTCQRWDIQSLDYRDPQNHLSYAYFVFVPEKLYFSFKRESFNIITGLEKSRSFSFRGNYTVEDNLYPLFFGVYTKYFLLRFFGSYGNLSSNSESVHFAQAGGEFSLFLHQCEYLSGIDFASFKFEMIRSELSDKVYGAGSLILGDEFHLPRVKLKPFFKTGFKPYIFSYNVYNPDQGLWIGYSCFAELGIRERTEKSIWGISLTEKDLLTTGNVVGFTIGGLEIRGFYEVPLESWNFGVSLSYYFGGEENIVKGNIFQIGVKLCRK
jgi:hypothetical protein